MNPLTYLGFTIFSVFMQFCVMEFINERLQLEEEAAITLNASVQKSNVLDKMKRKPHALFYRIETDQMIFKANNEARLVKYSNSSLEDIDTSTSAELLSTTFEEAFYDENTSVTDNFFTSESYFAITEFDNITEITLLDKTSTTTVKPYLTKKTAINKKCFCNLLYKKCDINCCCDPDCSEEDRILFINCGKVGCKKLQRESINFCSSSPTCGNTIITTGFFDDLFCVVKVNLPDQRVKSYFKLDEASINNTFKWKSAMNHNVIHSYKKKKYEHGDTVWILKNDSVFSLYLPTTVANNYCSGKKQMKFLINESIKCNIKVDDLYVFSALNMIEGTNLISVTESTLNNTALNCSTLHCSNWTILVCNEVTCDDYNYTIHSPKCNKEYCSNLPLKLEYIFYYSESKMTNASLKLYMKEATNTMPLLIQEISVKWYLGNESIDNTIQLSGNPGYISGLPIITSSAPNNHTSNFYNRTKYSMNRLIFPINENGKCVWPYNNKNSLMFGYNTRSKCRLRLQQKKIINKNGTSACRYIQSYIKESLGLNQKLFLSPYGNPQYVKDDNWIPLEVNDQAFLYGEHQLKETKVSCFSLVTRYAFEVAFADMSGKINQDEYKIVKATVNGTPFNVTFEKADVSIVLTIDIRFMDISRPISEFAKSPHLNINLPKNFFFDYPSNKCRHLASDIILMYLCSLIILNNK